MAEEQQQQVYQLAQIKDNSDGEEKTTNVLVIITQNGVASIPTNQQIVVVNPNRDRTKQRLAIQPLEANEDTPVIETEDLPLYQDVSVQTMGSEIKDVKKYSRMTANKKFKCLICGKELANGSILKRHIRIHTGFRPYQCSLCNKRFTQSNDLTAHMRSHTGSRPFKCEVCGKGFTQRQNVKKHMLTHTGEKNYECPVCGKKFGRKHHMEEHSRLHSESEIRCKICEKGFTANGHLKRHINKYHPQTSLEDDIKMIVRQEQNIENEMPVVNFISEPDTVETATVEVASIEPETPAEIVFENINVQQQEKGVETFEEIMYRCDLCEKQFKDLSLLERHLRLHLEGKLFNCTLCSKVFNYKGLLKRHMVVHTKIKPYECMQCNKKFTQSNDLKIHMRLHTGVKPFKCEYCSLCFNQKQQLKNHRRKHTGERPFACDKCEKRFSRRDHLKAHMKTHENDHLRCQICGFTSRNIQSLEKHSLKHENVEKLYGAEMKGHTVDMEHPLICQYCTKRFKDVRRLHKHEESHEKSKLFNCSVCGQTYFKLDTFKKHCKLHENCDERLLLTGNPQEETEEYVGTMIKIELEENEEDENSKEKSSMVQNDGSDEVNDEEANIDDTDDDNGTKKEGEENKINKNTMYCCSHCGKMLPWNADLVKHMETHLPDKPGERPSDVTKTGIVQTTNDGRYLCSICGRHFTNLIALQSHIKNIHSMDISDYELNYKESEGVMLTAEEIKEIEKQIQENLRFTGCYSVLKNASKQNKKALKGEDKEKPIYQCEVCAKVVKRKENLERHRKLHLTVHRCDICQKTFKQRNHLETHKQIKHASEGGESLSQTIFVCEEPNCGKYFNKKFNLLRHQELHNKSKDTSNDKSEEEEDNDEMENNDDMMYECQRCKELFETYEELEDHEAIHHADLKGNGMQESNVRTQSDEDRNVAEIVSIVTAASEAIADGDETTNNASEGLTTVEEFNGNSVDTEYITGEVIGCSAVQEVSESSDHVTSMVQDVIEASHHVTSENQNQVFIQIPQDGNLGEENVFQCQIVNSESGATETVLIPLPRSMVASTSGDTDSLDDAITMETLQDVTESDNTAAIAMVALSSDGTQYIEDEHAYVHIA